MVFVTLFPHRFGRGLGRRHDEFVGALRRPIFEAEFHSQVLVGVRNIVPRLFRVLRLAELFAASRTMTVGPQRVSVPVKTRCALLAIVLIFRAEGGHLARTLR